MSETSSYWIGVLDGTVPVERTPGERIDSHMEPAAALLRDQYLLLMFAAILACEPRAAGSFARATAHWARLAEEVSCA